MKGRVMGKREMMPLGMKVKDLGQTPYGKAGLWGGFERSGVGSMLTT